MATKEEILNTFNSEEGAWWAYKEGMRVGYNEALYSLKNQAAIAAMQGTITLLGSSDRYAFNQIVAEGYIGNEKTYPKEIAQFSVACANALVEELKINNYEYIYYFIPTYNNSRNCFKIDG